MRHIKQRHRNGCVSACLAMVSNVGYNKVLETILRAPKSSYKKPYPGVYMEDILRCMEKLKLKYKLSFEKVDITKLKNNAIINVSIKSGLRHMVVWDGKKKKIVDPWHKPSKIKINKSYIKKHMVYYAEIISS